MIRIFGDPSLERTGRAGADGRPAVDEALIDAARFGDVEVRRYDAAVGQDKGQLGVRVSAKECGEFGEFHGGGRQ
jgi:hypothetical protein